MDDTSFIIKDFLPRFNPIDLPAVPKAGVPGGAILTFLTKAGAMSGDQAGKQKSLPQRGSLGRNIIKLNPTADPLRHGSAVPPLPKGEASRSAGRTDCPL